MNKQGAFQGIVGFFELVLAGFGAYFVYMIASGWISKLWGV